MKRILLIEDDIELNLKITDLLSANGYFVESVYTGIEGRILLHKDEFDLVIVDSNGADIDGVDVVRNARAKKIILTSFGDEKVLDMGELTDIRFLDRPLMYEELLSSIDEMVWN